MENVLVFETPEALATGVARNLLRIIRQTVCTNGRCTIALTGGRTPIAINKEMIRLAKRIPVDWSQVYFFWGDERCVPPDHEDSNYKMNYDTLLVHLPVADANIHRFHGEDTPAEAARAYEETLVRIFDLKPGQLPEFDIILLGMGADGHTASLFPQTSALTENEKLAVENEVPQLGTYRLTLTYPVINNARHVIFLISGHAKRDMLRTIWHGPWDRFRYPAQAVAPQGQLIWWVDQTAMG